MISQNVCMYEDLCVKSTGTFVKWFKQYKHESSKRILRTIRASAYVM